MFNKINLGQALLSLSLYIQSGILLASVQLEPQRYPMIPRFGINSKEPRFNHFKLLCNYMKCIGIPREDLLKEK